VGGRPSLGANLFPCAWWPIAASEQRQRGKLHDQPRSRFASLDGRDRSIGDSRQENPPANEAASPDAASPATIRLNGQKVTFVANGDTAIVDVPAGANVLAASV
jgi:hypothetical protein